MGFKTVNNNRKCSVSGGDFPKIILILLNYYIHFIPFYEKTLCWAITL